MALGVKTLSLMSSSYQEKSSDYISVLKFFKDFFKEENICILSSHSDIEDIKEMIHELRKRTYNIAGIFFSNSYGDKEAEISLLDWNERLWFDNPINGDEFKIQDQIKKIAREFSDYLVAKSTKI